jgi:hypothetical protein
MHTPQDALRRIHEALHARHTFDRHRVDAPDMVMQLVEDVRLHACHWPWPAGKTPLPIATEVRAYLLGSLDAHTKAIEAGESCATDFPVFFESLRACAVCFGITGQFDLGLRLLPPHLRNFAQRCCELIVADQLDRQQAADEITAVFFADEEEEGPHRKTRKGKGSRPAKPVMEIVDLPKTERCSAQESGVRLATSGARIYRPALRRPVLPARLFVRNAPIEPAGTILIDASGSMGSFDFIVEQMRREPGATIAYYNASSGKGKLFIYAKDGWRADGELPSAGGGNAVDGPALDWLLQQDGPRIFITDRCFCGALDSAAQIVRLANAETQGLLTVRNYQDETGE